MYRNLFKSILLLQMILAVVTAGIGQDTAQFVLYGAVVDENNALIADVTLTLQDVNGKVINSQTDDYGQFRLDLPVATYKLATSKSGFCPEVRDRLTAESKDRLLVNLRLVSCAISSGLIIDDGGVSTGMHERLVSPFKEELLKIGSSETVSIQYGKKETSDKCVVYFDFEGFQKTRVPTQLIYGAVRITAKQISVKENGEVIAIGKVIIDDGTKTRKVDIVRFRLSLGQINIIPNPKEP